MQEFTTSIPARYYLGPLCKRNHNWHGTGQSLRTRSDSTCCECKQTRGREQAKYRGKAQWAKHKALVDAIKLGRGCADCGFRAHPAALHFDHLPGTTKKGGISRLATRSQEAILEEIGKCEVVCANCHAIRTAMRRKR